MRESNHQLSPSERMALNLFMHLLTRPRISENAREKGADCLSTGNGRFFSLRTKLLLFATALVLIPGGIYGAISLSSSRAALAQVVGRLLVEEAREGADRLATTLRSERERLESFAAQDVMREIRIEDFDKRISSFLGSVKRGCPACVDLLVLDRSGRVVASSNPSWIGETETMMPGGADAEERRLKGPFQATGAARTLIRFTVPVPDPDARAGDCSGGSWHSSTGSGARTSLLGCARAWCRSTSTPTCSFLMLVGS